MVPLARVRVPGTKAGNQAPFAGLFHPEGTQALWSAYNDEALGHASFYSQLILVMRRQHNHQTSESGRREEKNKRSMSEQVTNRRAKARARPAPPAQLALPAPVHPKKGDEGKGKGKGDEGTGQVKDGPAFARSAHYSWLVHFLESTNKCILDLMCFRFGLRCSPH